MDSIFVPCVGLIIQATYLHGNKGKGNIHRPDCSASLNCLEQASFNLDKDINRLAQMCAQTSTRRREFRDTSDCNTLRPASYTGVPYHDGNGSRTETGLGFLAVIDPFQTAQFLQCITDFTQVISVDNLRMESLNLFRDASYIAVYGNIHL